MEPIYFTKTSIGYAHLKSGKLCQDFSAAYHDGERTIVTACDGHGGRLYLRSHLGSKFASDAIVQVFSALNPCDFRRYAKKGIAEKLRLQILCAWNGMVERSYGKSPLRRKECRLLSEQESVQLRLNAAKAYGTTLNGAMVLDGKVICASLGDGGVFLLRGGALLPAFPESDEEETVANITHSMCQEDAYNHLKTAVFSCAEIDGVLLCTDGVINPYRNLANFNESFVQPVVALAREERFKEIEAFVVRLGEEIGIGDDVSLGLILNERRTKEKA